MSKHKLILSIFIFTLILTLICPFVFAEDKISENNKYENQLIDENSAINGEGTVVNVSANSETQKDPKVTETEENVESSTSETMITETNATPNDVYLIQDSVTIDYIVDGNVYVIADTVNIDAQIIGNAYICANNINISQQGYVSNSLFAISNNITIQGIVYDLYTTSENLTIEGYVYRDVHSVAKKLELLGTIGRNAFLKTSEISCSKIIYAENNIDVLSTFQGKVVGNLNYSAPSEIKIPEGTVDGKIKYEPEVISTNNYLSTAISFVVLTIALWLLIKWLSPKFINKAETLLKTKPLSVVGFGILGLIVIPLVSIALMLLNVTSSVGILFLALYFVLICISISIFIIALNNVICSKIKFDKAIKQFVILVILSIVTWLLTIIPYAGSVFVLIYMILGLGIIVKNILAKKEEKAKE